MTTASDPGIGEHAIGQGVTPRAWEQPDPAYRWVFGLEEIQTPLKCDFSYTPKP